MKRLNLCLVLWLPVLLQAQLETSGALKPKPPGRMEVLVIYPDDRPQPSTQQFDAGMRSELEKGVGEEIEIFTEYLGLDRFPGPEHEQNRASHLAARYRDHPPRIIIAAGMRALQFVRQCRGTSLPDVPVVFGGVRESSYQPAPDHTEYGVTMELSTRPTADLMLKLHPNLKEVVMVSGASFMDGRIEAVTRAELAPLEGKVRLRYWSGLPLPDLLNRARKLPPDSAIYFLSLFSDGRGLSVGSSRVDLQACKLEYSIVSPK